jgi:hypothetical protein
MFVSHVSELGTGHGKDMIESVMNAANREAAMISPKHGAL